MPFPSHGICGNFERILKEGDIMRHTDDAQADLPANRGDVPNKQYKIQIDTENERMTKWKTV